MLTLSKEKDRTTNNIWHSPSSKSNGIYSVEPVTHNTNEHDAGSLSSSPLSSPDSKNMQSEPQQHPDATETNFNLSSRQSSPLSELTNLNDDDQSPDQQQPEQPHIQQSTNSLSDSSSPNSNSNVPVGQVSNSNGNTDESRNTEVKSDLPAEQPASAESAGDSTNATATLSVTSRQQQTHQPQQHTNTNNNSKSSSPSSSSQLQPQQHVNGMGVPSPFPVHDYSSSSALTPAASVTYSSSVQTPAQSNELHPSKPSSDIPDEKAATIFLLNVELLKVCMEFQSRQLLQSPEFTSYATRLQSNLSWLAAVAEQNRQKNIPLPVMTPPVQLPWHPSNTINSFYQRLPSLFAKEIARRQAAAALAANANPGPGGGTIPPGIAGVQSPMPTGAGSLHSGSISTSHPSALGPRATAPGVPIQPAPPGMMAAGIKRGPPTDASFDEQNVTRKRIDTGERRHSNPPLASTASPPHARSPSVMSNGTGVSIAGPGAGGMGMNNMIGSGMGVSDMSAHHQAQIQSNLGMGMQHSSGMGGMHGMHMGQARSPHSDSNVGDTPTTLRNSSDTVPTPQVNHHSLQGAQTHGHQPNPQLGGLGVQGFSNVAAAAGGMNMSDMQQAQLHAAQMAQRARMLQQAQAMQSNRPNPNAMVPPGVGGSMKDPRMAAMMSNTGMGVGAGNPSIAMNQGQSHFPNAPTNSMNPGTATSTANPMNAAAGMSMQIQPPPPPNASMVQAIVNAFGPGGLSNYQALQAGSSHPFVSYMLTHVPGFAHLPWQQQLQRMQVVQNNIRQQQQQRLASAGGNIPQQGQVEQVNLRNGVMNPAMQAPGTSAAHTNQGHPQTPVDPTSGSPFNRQSGSPPNVGGMQAMPGSRGSQTTPGQAHRHMSPSPLGGGSAMGLPMRPGTAGSQGGGSTGGGGSMNMNAMGSPGGAPPPVSSGMPIGQNVANMTPQERQLRLMQQQMHQRGNDGVMTTQQAFTAAEKLRQDQPGGGPGQQQQQQQQQQTQQQQQHQVRQGQMGMHPGSGGQSSLASARSPPNTASGAAAPFGHVPPMGGTAMGMNMGVNMTAAGMGIGPMGGMANPNRSAPSPSDMLSAAAAARGGLAPNIAQKRPVSNAGATQNEMYHQMALYNQVQQRQQQQQQHQQHQHQQQQQQHQQQQHQQHNQMAGFRPSTAMGGMSPAAMAAAAAAAQQQQQQQQQQYANAGAAGGGTINPGMIYSGGGGGGGSSLGRVQASHPQQQQQVYLSQAQAQSSGQMSQSQPPYHAISPAALQHQPDGMTRIGTPGSVGGGMGGTPRPGSSASNPTSMLPTDGLGGDSLESLFNWSGE